MLEKVPDGDGVLRSGLPFGEKARDGLVGSLQEPIGDELSDAEADDRLGSGQDVDLVRCLRSREIPFPCRRAVFPNRDASGSGFFCGVQRARQSRRIEAMFSAKRPGVLERKPGESEDKDLLVEN